MGGRCTCYPNVTGVLVYYANPVDVLMPIVIENSNFCQNLRLSYQTLNRTLEGGISAYQVYRP